MRCTGVLSVILRTGWIGSNKEAVDLSGITITKRTLDEIYHLIEKDERYLSQIKEGEEKPEGKSSSKRAK